jgi:hypothetical protein
MRYISFASSGHHSNNKIERFNGELRDRGKIMRSIETPETPIISGMQIFHNFIRPHMGLNGQTLAEAAGIQIDREDKWLTIIQNSAHPTRVNSKNHPTVT